MRPFEQDVATGWQKLQFGTIAVRIIGHFVLGLEIDLRAPTWLYAIMMFGSIP